MIVGYHQTQQIPLVDGVRKLSNQLENQAQFLLCSLTISAHLLSLMITRQYAVLQDIVAGLEAIMEVKLLISDE